MTTTSNDHQPPGSRRVDVIVVTWNTRDLTVAALRRLLDTEQGCDVRVIVRDNGSTDGTAPAVAEDVPEAVLDHDDRNLGFAAGVNRALELSTAEWVLLLNSDAWPTPGAIGWLIDAAVAHPEAAAVAARIEDPEGRLEHSTHPFPSVRVALGMALGLPRLSRRWAERNLIEGAWHHDTARDVDWAIGAALLIRRRALDEIGGLDERYFMYAEDLEWCWRARSAGWTVRFEPASRFVHVGNASGRQRYAGRRTAAHLTNSYRFFRQAHGRAALWGYRTANVAGTLRQLLVGIVRRDRDAIRYWKTVMVAHLTPTPDDDPGRFIADPS